MVRVKTSLISIIMVITAFEGIAVFGEKIRSTDLRELRLKIGECSSEIRIWSITGKRSGYCAFRQIASIAVWNTRCQGSWTCSLFTLFLDFLIWQRRFNTLSDVKSRKHFLQGADARPNYWSLMSPVQDWLSEGRITGCCAGNVHDKRSPALIYITHHIEEIIPQYTCSYFAKWQIIASGKREHVLTNAFSVTLLKYHRIAWQSRRLWPMIMNFKHSSRRFYQFPRNLRQLSPSFLSFRGLQFSRAYAKIIGIPTVASRYGTTSLPSLGILPMIYLHL